MNYPLASLIEKFDQGLEEDPDQLRILLIGSAERIVQTIRQLHSLGFADVSDWSPLLPLPNSTDLFSLLTRRRF